MPGIKIGRSKAQLPLRVDVERIPVTDEFVKTLNDHLLLVYTGKTRLARNLLQVRPRQASMEYSVILITSTLPSPVGWAALQAGQ